MTTALFVQKARRALVAMRKATIDALLLTVVAFVFLVAFTGILFTYPLLIVLIYALAFLIAMLLRLRKASHETTAAHNQDQSLEKASQELSSTRTLIGAMLYWGKHGY